MMYLSGGDFELISPQLSVQEISLSFTMFGFRAFALRVSRSFWRRTFLSVASFTKSKVK